MGDNRLPRPKPSLIFKPLADGGLIFSPELETYFSVNAVGARVWSLLPPTSGTLDELVAALHAEHPDVGIEVLRVDLEELLADLTSHGLLEPAE